jgi:hypothetical protein
MGRLLPIRLTQYNSYWSTFGRAYSHSVGRRNLWPVYRKKSHPLKNKKTKPTRVPVKVVFVNMVIIDLVIP